MGTPLTLRVYRGETLLRTERFEREVVKIGRLASAHLRLDDDAVSRIHAVIEVRPDGRLAIVDMGSHAGTRVNGRRVSRGALKPGDEIGFGALRVVVDDGSGPALAAPEPERRDPERPPAEREPPRAQPPVEEPRPPPPPVAEPGRRAPEVEPPRRDPTPTPHDLLAAAAEAAGPAELGAELRLTWGDALLEARTFVRPDRPVLLGERADCGLRAAAPALGGDAFPLLRWEHGEYRLTLPSDGREVTLTPGAPVKVDLGARLAVEARLRRPPAPAELPWWERVSWRFANLVILLAAVAGVFVIGAAGRPAAEAVAEVMPMIDPLRLARFVAPAPPVRREERVARGEVPKARDQKAGESGERHRGVEGQMGKRDAPKVQARSAPKAIDPDDREIVKHSGLLAALGAGKGAPEGLSTVLGRGGLGGDLKGAVGNMFGAAVGDAFGFGGLGLKGEGQGGGGAGRTIGIGAVGTKGRGGGMGGYGSGVGGLGTKGEREIGVATGDARVLGAIDPELIRRVIREHASQVRYCYEQQLALDPKLEGKVAIRWQIEADGRATNPQVELAETTLRNAEVHRCIVARIVTWPFPKPKGGGIAIVKYPWILRTSGGAG